jgi:hypothetical protein
MVYRHGSYLGKLLRTLISGTSLGRYHLRSRLEIKMSYVTTIFTLYLFQPSLANIVTVKVIKLASFLSGNSCCKLSAEVTALGGGA